MTKHQLKRLIQKGKWEMVDGVPRPIYVREQIPDDKLAPWQLKIRQAMQPMERQR